MRAPMITLRLQYHICFTFLHVCMHVTKYMYKCMYMYI